MNYLLRCDWFWRLKLALNCLRGRPVMYRIGITGGGVVLDRPYTLCYQVSMQGYSDAAMTISLQPKAVPGEAGNSQQ